MAYDLTNFVIDRVVRAVAFDQGDDTKVLFSINQVTNPSLNVTSETAEAVDALGTPVAIFNRAKSCEFSAENALFDMGLMAAQSGASKTSASATNKIAVPMFETIDIAAFKDAGYKLSKEPVEGTLSVYALKKDGSFASTALAKDDNAGADTYSFSNTTGNGTIGVPTSLSEDGATKIIAVYQYEATGGEKDGAVSVINSAQNFPKACKLVMEVLGCDVCDQTDLIYAYLIFPNFKLSSDFDWTMSTDSTHPFSGRAMQSYCDADKKLYQLVIPEFVVDETTAGK